MVVGQLAEWSILTPEVRLRQNFILNICLLSNVLKEKIKNKRGREWCIEKIIKEKRMNYDFVLLNKNEQRVWIIFGSTDPCRNLQLSLYNRLDYFLLLLSSVTRLGDF